MNSMQALQQFWQGFNLPAYDENTVPDNAELPYITYEASDDNFGNKLMQSASLWYRSSSWSQITAKEQEIAEYITRGGRTIRYDGGAMWLQRATPWAQRKSEESNDSIRRIILNVIVEFLD